MFAASARSSAARSARVARNFATVVESAGVKVAAADHGQPTSSVTLLVKAGSRFDPKPGVAHTLKNFAFKSTGKRSGLGTVREAELYGGVLHAGLSREYLTVTADFLRGDESYFVDLLTSFITSSKFTRHELNESVAPVVEAESTAASQDSATRALELAHALAFRNGLGLPLFAPSHSGITHEEVKAFASSAFAKGNFAFLGTGIDQSTLAKLVEQGLSGASASSSSAPSTGATKYFGGESRLAADGPSSVFIGFGTTGAPTPEVAALAAHLSVEPAVKWSQGTSPIAAALPEGTSVKSVYIPYSDASLFGLLVEGSTPAGVKEAGKAAVAALKEAGSLKQEDVKKAVAKAKFAAASAVDSREGLVSILGAKVLAGSEASLDGALSAFDKVDASAFSKATSALLKSKPTYVAVGDITYLPHADELGL
ncbi:LuxS/MPP-like metallohydrolase [Punctularia strigosozonata HHB-11173 SS5]|uniref:Cytochrome b-c1 complex subunit 2, mitochondrial n=1 Tax=Punctularia strigosozonata (strain HHB-11173) TaxID=741275 RepID=R7S589_PUNST|nr:LuxS/MPP-like metallohydrolase [Punctularia strigosozonata HHB-11173 SS5]EIN05109.1 LuxS/MPP-like metallohydrolase [Punctularia strigosozonata HHB-11173 SS5]